MKHLGWLSIIFLTALLAGIFWGQVKLFPITSESWPLLRDFRIPRVLFAAVNGAMLSLAGVLYQISLRNPMADGFTTGAASSAALGGCFALVFWGHPALVSLGAIASAGLGIAVVRHVSFRSGSTQKVTIILAGIALSVVSGAGISFLKYFFEDSVNTMIFWLMGGLSGATFINTLLLATIFFLTLGWLLRSRHKLALLFLDDLSAESSGVNVRRLREALFLITTVLVAVSVSLCGVIGFLGLMVPHASRALFGHNITTQLLAAPLLGATALVLFDLLARVVLPHGGEIPVGIITSATGGVFFFFLLTRRGGKIWND